MLLVTATRFYALGGSLFDLLNPDFSLLVTRKSEKLRNPRNCLLAPRLKMTRSNGVSFLENINADFEISLQVIVNTKKIKRPPISFIKFIAANKTIISPLPPLYTFNSESSKL